MKTLTKTNIEELANEIILFLNSRSLSDSVSIYFNNKVMRSRGVWDEDYNYIPNWITEENVNPHDYFEWVAYDHILSMGFEGGLYDLINYRGGATLDKFMDIFEKRGLYYELGNAWNLSVYLSDDDIEVEYTYYEQPKETIQLYRWNREANPSELQSIMDEWFVQSSMVGDKGSCVLGAGFTFEWRGDKYFMNACSPYQGSISWEEPKDKIRNMLEEVGATEIYYKWGNMD
jgi:hypothetical protein